MTYSIIEREEKKKKIVKASKDLFLKKDYSAITMASLAKKLGMAKGTLYNFYGSKQEIFLDLYNEEIDLWISAIETIFSRDYPLNEKLDLFVKDHCQRQLLLQLMCLLNSVLENNLSYDLLLHFKLNLLRRVSRVSMAFVNGSEGQIKMETMDHFLMHYTAHIKGYVDLCKISPTFKKILKNHPELAIFSPSLEDEIRSYVKSYFCSEAFFDRSTNLRT